MSDVSQGPGWWLASDNKWYPPELSHTASQAAAGSVLTADPQVHGASDVNSATWTATTTVPRSHPDGSSNGSSSVADIPEAYHLGPPASPKRSKRRLVVVVATVAAAVILAVSLLLALGGGSAKNGLTGKSATQVLAMAMTAARQQGSVHLGDTDKPTSGGGTYDVGLKSGKQTIDGGSAGNATLLVLPDIAYLKADATFLQNDVGLSIPDSSRYAQKWISFVPSDTTYNYQQLVASDTLGSALSESTPAGPLTLTSQRTVDGKNVVGVSGGLNVPLNPNGAKGTAVLYVSTVAPYLPVAFEESGTFEGHSGSTTQTFSNWREPITVTAPTDVTPVSTISSSTS